MPTKRSKTKNDSPAPVPLSERPAPPPGERYLQPYELALMPVANNAAILEAWAKSPFGAADVGDLIRELREHTSSVHKADMRPIEAMLFGQAVALQSVFTNLMRRAVSQEYLKQFEKHMTLGLKAQAQCRATLEALAEIKNPRPVAFVKQANIANGPQQVNNGQAENPRSTHTPARAPEANAIEQTGLLGASDVERLDRRAQSTAGGTDPDLAPVGTLNRAP